MSKKVESSNIYGINHRQLIEIIKRVYEVKESLFITGAIGIGKSHSVREAAKQIAKDFRLEYLETKDPNKHPDKFCLIDQRMGQKDAGEVLGLPETYALLEVTRDKVKEIETIPAKSLSAFLDANHFKEYRIIDYITKWTSPLWFPRQGRGIIFLDELTLAPALVRNAVWELINDHALGDYQLPQGWVVIAAGNRGREDGCPEFIFEAPLSNRFSWFQLNMPSIEDWTEWAASHGVDMRIIGFLNTKRSALYTYNPNAKERAFSTPRSWQKASDLIKGIEDEDKLMLYISGRVGTYVAGEFKAFLQQRRKLPPVEEFIKKCKEIPLEYESDLLYTLCTNITEYVLSKRSKPEEARKILSAVVIIGKRMSKEFATFLFKLIKSSDETFFRENILQIPEWTSLSNTIGKYLLNFND